MPDELTLGTTTATVQDDSIVLTIELRNDADRTMHAYRDARRWCSMRPPACSRRADRP